MSEMVKQIIKVLRVLVRNKCFRFIIHVLFIVRAIFLAIENSFTHRFKKKNKN